MHSSSGTNIPMIVLSILATAICWGVYGPLLQWGHLEMGSGRLRPFICVGFAYIVVAIVGPILVMMVTDMERGEGITWGWTMKGVWWSFIAGTAGALGALGMILAFNFGGKPHYVPPLIFGLAPVVNTFFALSLNPQLRTQLATSPIQSSFFGAGLLMVAIGAVVVLVAAPKASLKPAAVAKPPAVEAKSLVAAVKPASLEAKPPSVQAQPPVTETHLSAGDDLPPKSNPLASSNEEPS